MLTKVEAPRNYKRLISKQKETKDVLQIVDENGYLREVSFADLTSHPTTIAGYGITDAYIQNGTIYLGENSITPAAVSSLGTAAYKDYTTSIAQNITDLPTSGAVYSAIAAAVSSALHYRGISSTALTDGGTETATIGGVALVPQDGDVVIYDGFEFLWESNQWNKLGDDTSYALKTIQIAGDGTYITGGGQLTQNQTLTLSSSVIASLGKADTAVQPATLGDYLPLTAGSTKALTGDLFLDATLGSRYLRWTTSSNIVQNALSMFDSGALYIGADQRTNNKSTSIFGSTISLIWNPTTQKTIVFDTSSIRPNATGQNIQLGHASYPFAKVYADNLYGNLALSYLTGADDLKAIEALTGTGFAKRTADNTWALTNDIEATSLKTIAESDASFTYRKTPNTAVGDTLKIKRILGKTIVWNQWADNDTPISYSYNNTGSSTTSRTVKNFGIKAINNHKYYIRGNFLGTITNTVVYFGWISGTVINVATTGAILQRTGGDGSTNITLQVSIPAGETINGTFQPVLIDLTQKFGSGYEPTLEQFESWYYKNYYNYDTGSLQSNRAASIETTGFNQWDEEWESGYWDVSNGSAHTGVNWARSKNPIRCLPSTAYCIHTPANLGNRGALLYYDAAGNYLNYDSITADVYGSSGFVFTTPAGCWRMKFYMGSGYNGVPFCLNLSNPDRNGTYEPYHKDTLTLNLTSLTSGGVAVCPEGLKAADYAGTVCDETDGQVLKNRVGRINLGDLDFIKSGDTYYVAFTSAKAPASSYDVANMIPSKFSVVARNSQTTLSDEIALASNGNLFITPSTSYADAAAFKVAMNGVYLDYELATPVDYVLDTPITMLVASDINGTQRRLPEDTESSVQAPFRADFQYGVNPDDIIQDLNTKLQDLDNRYLPANALSNVTDITGTGLLTMPRAAISDSLLVPTLCRQQQGDVILEWYEAKASLYVKENDLTLHIVLNGNDYSLNLN